MDPDIQIAAIPFAMRPSHHAVWEHHGSTGTVTGRAPALTDLYVDPAGHESGVGSSTVAAPTLLGIPPSGDFQLSARVAVDFASTYDAGALMVWIDDTNWAKFCLEYSPAGDPMVVSVVTKVVSDDANAFVVAQRSIWLRLSKVGRAHAFHASVDGAKWQLIRVFSFGDEHLGEQQIGFEVQSPTGDGCTVVFDHIAFATTRLGDLRDGT